MSAAVAQAVPIARRFAPKGAYSWSRALPALNVSDFDRERGFASVIGGTWKMTECRPRGSSASV